jgi:predicted phage terminase large subunit-like protein
VLDAADVDEFLGRQLAVERELGMRSFYDFYKMAWGIMDPEPFVDGKHIRVICHHMQRAARREERRVAICIPPRHSKSLLCSVAFPAWVWTWWQAAKFITSSYGLSLATRDAVATRRLVESPWYQARWPETRFMGDQNQKTFYQTTAGGQRFVGSPGTGVTGQGADFALFDDPHDITEGESEAERQRALIFWFETMSGRFNNPARGVSIVIQQRVHTLDVAGEAIRRGYYHVVLPARFERDHPHRHEYDWRTQEGQPLWPEKFSDDVLSGLWATLGGVDGYAVAGQQQQRPQPRQGGLFKRHWFKIIEAIPAGTVWVRAWDLASTEKIGSADPDWTVGIKFGFHAPTKTFIIGNVVRDRLDPGGTLRMLKAVAQQDGRQVDIFIPQDPGQAGKSQIQHYVSELAGWTVKFTTMTGSKTDRASPLASQCEVGNVALYKADWNEDFLAEISAFPTGGHDDQVDAAASGFSLFVTTTTGIVDWASTEAERIRQANADLRASMGYRVIQDYVPQPPGTEPPKPLR